MKRPNFLFQVFLIMAGAVFAIRITSGEPWTFLRITGAALMALGIVVWIRALVELGAAFTWKPQATQLVTTGPYARLRNPIYVSRGMAIAGWFLLLGMPQWLLLGAIVVPVQWWRARREALTLEAEIRGALSRVPSNNMALISRSIRTRARVGALTKNSSVDQLRPRYGWQPSPWRVRLAARAPTSAVVSAHGQAAVPPRRARRIGGPRQSQR